jgi:L-asparagine transporter-like permease
MMKIKFNREKLQDFIKKAIKAVPLTIIILVVISFLILTYMAIMPSEDLAAQEEGQATVDSLNIQFNAKLLKDLSNTSKPASVGETGGRDPFSPF